MASKRRIRRRQCNNKKRFETSGEAGYLAYKLMSNGKDRGSVVHVYRCKFCGGYHVGHMQRGTKNTLREKGVIA